jgi:redox-sensitive bicupin YhaK (pirin superfamily)
MRVPACNCRYLKVTMRSSFGRRKPRAHGPFAMNISDEIHQAMRDYAAGRL